MKNAALLVLLAPAALLSAGHLIEGNRESAVRVVIYEDLQCPDCAAFRSMLDEKLLPRFGARVAFEHRDFPLAKHAWARKAAVAARFFEETDPQLGLAFRRHALSNIKTITADNFNDALAAFARARGLDSAKVLAALGDPKYASQVEEDFQEGIARGVSKTPTVFVDGAPFVETFTFEEIAKGIDAALAVSKR
jgi:protein-disulfide isomerase